jgi:hypothetical protein
MTIFAMRLVVSRIRRCRMPRIAGLRQSKSHPPRIGSFADGKGTGIVQEFTNESYFSPPFSIGGGIDLKPNNRIAANPNNNSSRSNPP